MEERVYTLSIQGITIKPLVRLIKVKTATESKPSMNEVIHGTVSYDLHTRVYVDLHVIAKRSTIMYNIIKYICVIILCSCMLVSLNSSNSLTCTS